MPRKSRQLSQTGIYHIINRGIGKQIIFEDERDFNYFLKIIKKVQEETNFELIAYCLMENHFHLLLKIQNDPGEVVKKICVTYAYYFNKRYERTGHLFQDRFKSQPIENDSYFINVIRYIHDNPENAGICKREEYKWSSYKEYRYKPILVTTHYLFDMIGGKSQFETLNSKPQEGTFIDVAESSSIGDSLAQKIITEDLGLISGLELQNFTKTKRNDYIKKMKLAGLSNRQIARLTGIGRGIVERI